MFATDEELLVFKRLDGSPMSDAEVRERMRKAYAEGWRMPRMFHRAGILHALVSREVCVDETGAAC